MDREERNRLMTELYLAGERVDVIAEKCGLSVRGVRWVLNSLGVKIRSVGKPRVHDVNEDFFKSWSNNMAWVLGMIITDGYISVKKYSTSFAIVQKDESILYLIKDLLGYTGDLVKESSTRSRSLTISSKEMVKDLMNLGLTARKSLTTYLPTCRDEFLPHLMRGIFDGDGWVQDRCYVANITTASPVFSTDLKAILNSWGLRCEISSNPSKLGTEIYRVWIKGRESILKFYDIIYSFDDGLYTKKRQRYLEYMSKLHLL